MAKVTTHPTRSGDGFVIKVDGKSAAWISAGGGSTIGRAYKAALGKAPVPAEVQAAIEKARARAKRAASRKEEG